MKNTVVQFAVFVQDCIIAMKSQVHSPMHSHSLEWGKGDQHVGIQMRCGKSSPYSEIITI